MAIKIIKESSNRKDIIKYLMNLNISSDDLNSYMRQIENLKSMYNKIDHRFNDNTGPGTMSLPDGHPQMDYFISNDPNEYEGVVVVIAGDINNASSDNVIVYVSYQSDNDEFEYSKEFDYYTDLPQAIKLANALVKAIKPEASAELIMKICKHHNMERN